MDDHTLTTEHSDPVLDIPEAKVYEFVMKELKLELDRGPPPQKGPGYKATSTCTYTVTCTVILSSKLATMYVSN